MSDCRGAHLDVLPTLIAEWAAELGFSETGICGIDLSEDEAHLLGWLADGRHGQMDYMARHGCKRSRPADLVPGTVTVISARMDYWPGGTARPAAEALADPLTGYVSRYALGRDYHRLMRRRLQRLADRIEAHAGPFGYRAFVDSAPVLERALARDAGLGWIGKHTNLIHPRAGSWFFLGELYTDLPPPRRPRPGRPLRALPGMSRRLPDRGDHRPLPARRAPVHRLPHHRASGIDPGGAASRHRQPHLRLRRLPARMPLEPVRPRYGGGGLRAAARSRSRAPHRALRVGRGRFRALH